MQPRYVIVPALPKDKDHYRRGVRIYATTACDGFDIYDNMEKIRLQFHFQNRRDAESQCSSLNASDATCFPILRTKED